MKKVIGFLVSAVIILGACPIIGFADEIKTVTVSTAEELMDAIASNTRIILNAGRYEISPRAYPNPYGDDYYIYVYNLEISNVENLEICGNGEAEIVTELGNVPVIYIYNSSNVVLDGITLGHDVPEYGCDGSGYVIELNNVINSKIDNCDLYGCGVVGLVANGVKNLSLKNTTIRDCMMNIVNIFGFSENGWDDSSGRMQWVSEFIEKSDITFNDCDFLRNAYNEEFAKKYGAFQGCGSSAYDYCNNFEKSVITFNNCNFADNNNTVFTEEDIMDITINNCTFSNNAWDTPAKTVPEPCFSVNQPDNTQAEIYNDSDTEQTALLIIADYNGDDTLENLTSEAITLSSYETRLVVFSGSERHKIFIWNSLKGMCPMTK